MPSLPSSSRMRPRLSRLARPSLVLLAMLTASCSGCKDDEASGETKSIANATPGNAYLGRTIELTVTGQGTHFAGKPTLSFNDPAITLAQVDVLSPTSLRAKIDVGEEAVVGPHDVIVTTPGQGDVKEEVATLRAGLVVSSALKHQIGSVATQGGLIDFDIANLDKDNPFTGPAPMIVSGAVLVKYTEVSPERLAGVALVDARAPIGPLRLKMIAHNAKGEQVTFVSAVDDPNAPKINEERPAFVLTPGVVAPNEALAAPKQANLYKTTIPAEDQVFVLQFGTVGASLQTISGARLLGALAPSTGKFGEGRFFDTTFDSLAGSRVAVGLAHKAGDAYFAVHSSDFSGGPNEYNYALKLSIAQGTKFSMKEPSPPDGPTAPLTSFEIDAPQFATDGAIDTPEDADYILFTPKKAGRVFVQATPVGTNGPLNVTVYGDDPGSSFCTSYMAGGLGTTQAEFKARADTTYCVRINSTSRLTMPYEIVMTPELP